MAEDVIKLLIIDDDEVDRMTIQRSLAKANIPAAIDMAEKGKDGLAMLERVEYDCMFIDYVLPDTNGVALLKEIRAKGISTPIVIVTSHGDERVAIEAIRNGASDYISKNLLTPEGVSHSVRNALKVYEAEKEKRAAEVALLQSESRLKEAQKLAKLGNWEYSLVNKKLTCSDEVYNIYDLDPHTEPTYNMLLGFIHPDDVANRQQIFAEALAHKAPYQVDYRLITPIGRLKYVTANGTPIQDEAGEITAVVGTIQDISDRISTQIALQESEERYRMLIETMNEGVLHVNQEQIILFANKRLCELMGYSREEVIGQPVDMFIPDERNRKIMHQKNALREQRISDQYEIALKRKDGAIMHFLIGASPLLNPAGSVIGSLGTLTDITERKKIEEALSSSEKLLRTLFENAQGFICTHQLDGAIISVNKAGADMVGVPASAMVNQNLFNFIDKSRTNTIDLYLKNIKAKKQVTGIFPFINVTNGKKHYLLYRNVLYQEAGKEPYVIVTGQDITERIHFEKELTKAKQIAENSVKVKEQFLANISHEIRTPMNGIIGLTSVLQKMVQDPEQQNFLKAIQTSADKLLVIINDILDFSKIESGKIDLEITEFNPKAVLQETLQLFKPQADERNNKLQVSIQANVPEVVMGDPGKLTQVLNNLIGNAIKFTQEGFVKVLTTVASEEADTVWLEFTVQDSGIGIPKDKINSIFESFTQASSDTSRKYGGTGLGLTICKKLVELQGGSIEVKSKPRLGSSFIFRLPFKKATTPTVKKIVADDAAGLKASDLGGLRLLLAEDNEINQLLVKKIITDWGFTLDIAQNGLKALELFNQNEYDLILMDMQMPEMDGYEATEYIRKSKTPKSRTPIIALTAHATTGEMEKCQKAGADAFVSKPFKPENLLQEIAALTKNRSRAVALKASLKKEKPAPDEINLDYLREMADGDNAFIEEIITMFIQQTPADLDRIETLAETGNWPEVKALAHKMKSSVVLVGSKKLEKILIDLQAYAKEPDKTKLILPLIKEGQSICQKAVVALKSELKTLARD